MDNPSSSTYPHEIKRCAGQRIQWVYHLASLSLACLLTFLIVQRLQRGRQPWWLPWTGFQEWLRPPLDRPFAETYRNTVPCPCRRWWSTVLRRVSVGTKFAHGCLTTITVLDHFRIVREPELQEWIKLEKPEQKRSYRVSEELRHAVDRFYFSHYCQMFRSGAFARANSSMWVSCSFPDAPLVTVNSTDRCWTWQVSISKVWASSSRLNWHNYILRRPRYVYIFHLNL